jgi:AcrR family transcriptional regulator
MFRLASGRGDAISLMNDKTDPREAILKAAGERILHYGYTKTTMSEIASDCGMSAGNIYRFYPSKIDIAEALTRRFNNETHQAYAQIVRDPARSAAEKLRDFFDFRLERSFRIFEKNPKLMELAEIMARERPEYLAEASSQERLFVEKILQDGVRRGEFALSHDFVIAADLVQCCTLKFHVPKFWTTERLEDLRAELSARRSGIEAGGGAGPDSLTRPK